MDGDPESSGGSGSGGVVDTSPSSGEGVAYTSIDGSIANDSCKNGASKSSGQMQEEQEDQEKTALTNLLALPAWVAISTQTRLIELWKACRRWDEETTHVTSNLASDASGRQNKKELVHELLNQIQRQHYQYALIKDWTTRGCE